MNSNRPDPQSDSPLQLIATTGSVDSRNQSEAISTILNSLDALVYVADMDTHELLFINDYGKTVWGNDAEGKYCWEVLQDASGPCNFCTNDQLVSEAGEPTGVHVWEFRNTVNGHWYQCRDQAIRWVDGRLVRMEIATDISDRKMLEEELEAARRRAEALSRTDELTGVHNRRAFFQLGESLFSMASRSHRPLAVVMLDVDHFKRINDRYGHFAGDEVLRELARAVDARIRDSDVLGRFGGEEFVLVLPDTDPEQAMAFAERLRAGIADTDIEIDDDTLACTVSIGVAVLSEHCLSLEQLLTRADEALFRAKAKGRNRSELFIP